MLKKILGRNINKFKTLFCYLEKYIHETVSALKIIIYQKAKQRKEERKEKQLSCLQYCKCNSESNL